MSNSIKYLIGCMAILMASCYSFSGITVDPNIRTYYVGLFDDKTPGAFPGLDQIFTEDLKEKIRTQSRLIYTENEPDVSFIGSIVDFRVTSEAPSQGETTAVSRLTIKVYIEFENTFNEEKSWTRNFDFFFDYDATQDLLDVQDEAVATISDQINENVFNAAFNDW